MKKRAVIDEIQVHLIQELQALEADGEATDPEKVERANDIKRQMVMYRFLPQREYGPEDVICPASLVELELGTMRAFYFIVPQGGGLVTRVEGKPVQVITPNSPLGEVLLGRRVGETVRVEVGGKTREYQIISLN